MRTAVTVVGIAIMALAFGHSRPAQADSPPPECAAEWNVATVYNAGGIEVSQYGVNYTSNYYTQGDNPEIKSGYPGSPWSETNICHTCEIAPSKPTQVTAVATNDTQTDLIWSASRLPLNCSVSGYTVYQNGKKIGSSTGNNFSVGGLKPSTQYGFTVKAADQFGTSHASGDFAVRTAAKGQNRGPTPVFAPYVDMNQALSEQLPTIMKHNKITHATLAFLVSPCTDPKKCAVEPCDAQWGGVIPYNHDTLADGQTILSLVKKIRANGGDVIVSFGGSAGTPVAEGCGSVTSLTKIYQKVINRYQATSVDFDIEGGASSDNTSLDLRAEALVKIRQQNPNLTISYTLAVEPTGLATQGLSVLKRAKNKGFEPDVVNIMAMDYSVTETDMGLSSINAANNTALQLQKLGLTARVGVTPMIGVNDSNIPPISEITGFTDAQEILDFAMPNPDIARLAMWSLNRDNGSCPGNQNADATCDGLTQPSYKFIHIFRGFGAQ